MSSAIVRYLLKPEQSDTPRCVVQRAFCG
jgi:hypothetical protein